MAGKKPKLIAILGPTASGKSTLGIKLAQEFDGEIVSADSRQVYRGLDIGSGKVTPDEQRLVPHHLLDVVEPMADFSLAHFQPLAFAAIDDILARDRIPFLVGGTALYIYSVVDNYNLSDVGANPERRKELEKKSVEELQSTLANASPLLRGRLGGGLNESDAKNPRRLIRAIEKLESGESLQSKKGPQKYDNLILGTDIPREELYKKIDQRVDERIKQGMIEEVKSLICRDAIPRVSENWLIGLGLEYRYITEHLQGKCTKDEMVKRLKGAIHAFARRQMTWFKRDKKIIWIKELDEARQQVKNFLQ